MTRDKIPEFLSLVTDEELKKNLLALHEKILPYAIVMPASVKRHHSFEGGYIDHIAETVFWGIELFKKISDHHKLNFNLDDVILVTYVHDLDKLLRYKKSTDAWRIKKGWIWEYRDDVLGFDDSAKVVQICAKFDIQLEDNHLEAISHHHGGWSDNMASVYSYGKEMTKFSTLVACADLISGFIFGKYNK